MVPDDPQGKDKEDLESADTVAASSDEASGETLQLSGETGAPSQLAASARQAALAVARADAPRLEKGASVGRLTVLETLGEGGFGVVLSAYDPELDRKVALKLLHQLPDDSEPISQGAARLRREARALARLSHPGVVAVHDVGTHRGRLFIAMEYVEGGTLGAWLREEPRSCRADRS